MDPRPVSHVQVCVGKGDALQIVFILGFELRLRAHAGQPLQWRLPAGLARHAQDTADIATGWSTDAIPGGAARVASAASAAATTAAGAGATMTSTQFATTPPDVTEIV